jgi:hypothetical protein
MSKGLIERVLHIFNVRSIYKQFPERIEVYRYDDKPDEFSIQSDLMRHCSNISSFENAHKILTMEIKRGLEARLQHLNKELEQVEQDMRVFNTSGIDGFVEIKKVDYSKGI